MKPVFPSRDMIHHRSVRAAFLLCLAFVSGGCDRGEEGGSAATPAPEAKPSSVAEASDRPARDGPAVKAVEADVFIYPDFRGGREQIPLSPAAVRGLLRITAGPSETFDARGRLLPVAYGNFRVGGRVYAWSGSHLVDESAAPSGPLTRWQHPAIRRMSAVLRRYPFPQTAEAYEEVLLELEKVGEQQDEGPG